MVDNLEKDGFYAVEEETDPNGDLILRVLGGPYSNTAELEEGYSVPHLNGREIISIWAKKKFKPEVREHVKVKELW